MAISKHSLAEPDLGRRPIPRVFRGPAFAGLDAAVASPVFVGREQELARLVRGLAEVTLATIIGLPGVGKSALAQRLAAGWSGPVSRHHVRPGQPAAELLDDLRRSLAPEAEKTPELGSDLERLADAARRLDRSGALAIIEDADRLGDCAPHVIAAMAASLERARVVVTSRTRLRDGGLERVEIVLGGLDQEAARELWDRLDDLYGDRTGFEAAWRRTAGNPFYLCRAHEGDLDGDPIGATVAALDAYERRLALALALVGMPLAREVASRLLGAGRSSGPALPAGAARVAIGGLVAKLVVDTTWRGELVVHDLLAEGLRAAASPEELAAAHRALAEALEETDLGLIAGTRLRVRHMAAAGLVRPARDLLLARARELVRSGGAGELLRGLDLVTGEADTEARLARARAMARMLDFGRAYDELVALGADRPDAGAELRATFAHLALLTLRLDVAARVSRTGALSTSISPELRVRFATVYLITATYQGEGAAARDAIDGASAGQAGLMRGYAALSRGFSLWLEERDGEAEQSMRAPSALLRGALAFRAGILAPTFMVSVLARAGKTNDAAAALREAEAALARFDDPLMRVSLRALRATLLESQGDFAAARDEAAAVEDVLAQAGHLLGVLWIRLVRGRLMLHCGQVGSGRRLLDQVTRDASSAGATLLVRLAARAGRADPSTALTSTDRCESTRPGEQRRERVISVLRSLAAGQVTVARGYMAAIDGDAIDPLERALLTVADWALEAGEAPAQEEQRVTAACEEAARAGADPELMPAIVAWLRDRMAARSRGPARLVVVDQRSDTVQADPVVVELGRRPALRRLLYAMLEAPGRAHDRASLARAIWSVDYRAVHDGALWINVKRLRALLAPTGLLVATDEEGVRLRLEPGCELQVIAP